MTALTGQFAQASQASARAFVGEDPTGTVRLVLDEAGQPAEVDIAPRWRDTVGAGGLANAVRQAWQAAAGPRGCWPAPSGPGSTRSVSDRR